MGATGCSPISLESRGGIQSQAISALANASLSRENAKARRRAAGRLHLSGMKLAFQVTVVGALAGLVPAPAGAQWWQTVQPAQAPAASPPAGSRGENLGAGKSAAQLFASDCTGAGCHKGPQGLTKDRGQPSLASFLSEHYTTSRESAAALAASIWSACGPAPRGPILSHPRSRRSAGRRLENRPTLQNLSR